MFVCYALLLTESKSFLTTNESFGYYLVLREPNFWPTKQAQPKIVSAALSNECQIHIFIDIIYLHLLHTIRKQQKAL